MSEPVRTYRSRAIGVQAIHWLGEANCEEVFAFLGLEHHEDGSHTWIENVGPAGAWAEAGDWIVRDINGDYEALTNEEFHTEFEPADSEPPELSWGEIVVEHPQHNQVRIPLCHGNNDAGALVMDREQVAVLVKMLQDLGGDDAR